RETLAAPARAAAAVARAVGARAVPGHADEQGTVVAEVRGPPVLRLGHQLLKILLDGLQIEALELLSVVEARTHGVRLGRALVQDVQLQLVRPPVLVRRPPACGVAEGALAFV